MIIYARNRKKSQMRKKLEDYCAEECDIGSHICNILNQYNKINDFEDSELYKIMDNDKTPEHCLLQRMPV